MEPTIHPSDVILTNKLTPRFGSLHVGDIVVCKSMTNPDNHVCKRIVGLQYDSFRIGDKTHTVSLNSTVLEN